MKKFAVFALGMCFVIATGAIAAEIPSHDRKFATAAAQAGAAEVAEAKLALKKARRADLRKFAEHMVAAHTKANAELAALAKQLGVDLPEGLDPGDQQRVDELTALSGKAFDRAYIIDQISLHDSAVSLFTTEESLGHEAHLRALASSRLPMLKEHQAKIKKIAGF
jgi:putative membrane protein